MSYQYLSPKLLEYYDGFSTEELVELIRDHITRCWNEKDREVLGRGAVKTIIARRFGTQYGWELDNIGFGLRALRQHSHIRYFKSGDQFPIHPDTPNPPVDHYYFYRKDGKAAAIAGNLYAHSCTDNYKRCKEFAAENGLVFFVPNFPSWHDPVGGTTLVAYAHPDAIMDGPRVFNEKAHDHGMRDMFRHALIAEIVEMEIIARHQLQIGSCLGDEPRRVVAADVENVFLGGDFLQAVADCDIIGVARETRGILHADEHDIDLIVLQPAEGGADRRFKILRRERASASLVPNCQRTRSGFPSSRP